MNQTHLIPSLVLAFLLVVPASVKAGFTLSQETTPIYFVQSGEVEILSPSGSLATLASGFTSVSAMAVDPSGDVYISVTSGQIGAAFIDKITPSGAVSTFATGLTVPVGMVFDKSGNLCVAEDYFRDILKFTPSGTMSLFAQAPVTPYAMTIDPSGNLILSSSTGLYKVSSGGTSAALNSTIRSANGLAVDSAEDIYCAAGTDLDEITAAGKVDLLENSVGNVYDTIAIDNIGNLFVPGSSGNGVLDVYTPGGTFESILSGAPGGVVAIAIPATPVPEPSSIAFVAMGLFALARRR